MLHRVKDLSAEQKLAIESLLGRSVSEDESVSVKSIQPSAMIPCELSPGERIQALRELNEYFAARNVELRPVSEEEEEAIANEALRTTRPNYRPID